MKDLYKSNFVYGEGPVPCDIFLLGEAPGKEEDIWGKPFIGKAGTVLTRMLKRVSLKRSEVYITNAVKQRPPNNRTPLFQEIMLHRKFLLEEIETVKPKVLVILGKTALKALTGKDIEASISSYKYNEWYYEQNIPVIVTYHPASLLYGGDPSSMIKDFQRIKPLLKGAKHVPPKR